MKQDIVPRFTLKTHTGTIKKCTISENRHDSIENRNFLSENELFSESGI
jgi:hypothetical protein